MAQGKAGASLDLQLLHGHAVPEAAASAHGGVTGAGDLVLLYKPLPFPYRPGSYAPFAVVQLQDLPEQLRRQITGGGFYAQAAAPLGDEGAERHQQLLRAAHPVVVPEVLSRQLPGVASLPHHDAAVMFAGAFEREKGSMRAWLEQFGGWAPSIRRGADAAMGAFYGDGLHAPLLHKKNPADGEVGASDGDGVPARENVERVAALLLHKRNPADGEMDAFDGNGVPVLLLHKNKAADFEMGAFYITALPAPEYPDGLFVLPGDDDADAVPFLLGSNRSAEQGFLYNYNSGVLVSPPENLMPAWEATHSPTYYAVQVSVDAAGGAKAGDPIAVDVKADAGEEEEAGHEHDNLSAVVGIVAASTAATALSAGAVGPVMAFGLFAVLVGGLSLAMASVRAA